jgi:hypothetical protein
MADTLYWSCLGLTGLGARHLDVRLTRRTGLGVYIDW